MKRLLVAIVAAITLASVTAVLVQPKQAGAATVQQNVIPAKGDTSWVGIAGQDPHAAAVAAKKEVKALESTCKGQPASTPVSTPSGSTTCGAAVSIGLWTVLVTFTHAETGAILWETAVAGEPAAIGSIMCGAVATLLGGPWAALFVVPLCVWILAVEGQTIQAAMQAAFNTYTWLTAWWCTSLATSCPGAWPVKIGNIITRWAYPAQITGFNVLYTWIGIPIAWQANEFSG